MKPRILLTLIVLITLSFSCGKKESSPTSPSEETEEWNILERSGPIKVNVSSSLEAPKISWDDGHENKCYWIYIKSSSNEDMWDITGDLSSPVTYGNVPEGATEESKAISLKKGTQYNFSVFWAHFTVGTTNEGFGFVDVVYE